MIVRQAKKVLFTKFEYLILNHRCSPLLSGNLQNIDYSSMEFLAAGGFVGWTVRPQQPDARSLSDGNGIGTLTVAGVPQAPLFLFVSTLPG